MIATVIISVIIAAIIVFGVFHLRKSLRSGCCGSGDDPTPKRIKVKDRDLSHYPYKKILDIKGMTCSNCVTHVQNALNSLTGVCAKVDLGSRQASVYMKEDLPDQMLRKAIADAGYTAGSICTVMRQ